MNFEDYQKAAFFTARPGTSVQEWVVGLYGETGEAAEAIKKRFLRDNPSVSLLDIADEAGDVFWYACAIHTAMGTVPDGDNYPIPEFSTYVNWVLGSAETVGKIARYAVDERNHMVQFACDTLIAHYLSLLAHIGISLDTVFERNLRKLRAKYNNNTYVSDAERLDGT